MARRPLPHKGCASASEQSLGKTLDLFVKSINAPFYTTGFVDACPSVALTIPDQEDVQILAPPYPTESLDALYENAVQSQVGTKEETMLRLDARRSKEFENVTVQSTESWTLDHVCEEIQRKLAPGASKVHAQLYKLLIYRKGDFFHCHQDAQQAANMFGSLLFFLPIDYEGGIFQLSKLQTSWSPEQMIDVEDRKDPKGCSWVAFFTDVIHQVTNVIGGSRVVLNYTLSFEDCMSPSPHLSSLASKDVEAVRSYFRRAQGDIVLPLFYTYTKASLSPAFLKGRDAHLFNAMHTCGLEVALQFVLRTDETVVTTPPWTPSYEDDWDEPPESDWSQEFRGDVVLVEPALVAKSYALEDEISQMEEKAREKKGEAGYRAQGRDPWYEYCRAREEKRRALVDEILGAQKNKPKPKWIHLKRDDNSDLHGRSLWHVGSKYTTQWLGNMTPPVEFFYMEAAMIVRRAV